MHFLLIPINKIRFIGNQSTMEIEWYSLTFVPILMNPAINKESEKNEENLFTSKFQFSGLYLIKKSSNQKIVLDYLSWCIIVSIKGGATGFWVLS